MMSAHQSKQSNATAEHRVEESAPEETSDLNELRSCQDGLLFWGMPVVIGIGMAAMIASLGLNIPPFLSIQRAVHGPPALWQSITLFGNGLVGLVLCALWLRSWPAAIWAAMLGAIPAALVTRILKLVIDVPRPAALLDEVQLLGPAYRHASFPSGHAMTAFLLAGIACSVHRSASARLLILTATSLVALSRIVVGLHWLIDVLCGAAAGWVSAQAGLVGARRWPIARWKVAPLVLVVVVFAASLTLFHLEFDLPLVYSARYALAAAGCVLCAFALFDLLKRPPFADDGSPWFFAASFSIPLGTLAVRGPSVARGETLRSRTSEEGEHMNIGHAIEYGVPTTFLVLTWYFFTKIRKRSSLFGRRSLIDLRGKRKIQISRYFLH